MIHTHQQTYPPTATATHRVTREDSGRLRDEDRRGSHMSRETLNLPATWVLLETSGNMKGTVAPATAFHR